MNRIPLFVHSSLSRLALIVLLLLGPGLAAALEPLSDDDLLLFDLRMDRYVLTDTLTSYRSGETLLLSLTELSSHLALAIDVDAAAGRASGWFIDESRHFSLQVDGGGGVVEVEGESLPVPASAVIVSDDDIFVDYNAFSAWLPIDFAVDMPNLIVTATPRETLPVQERIRRMNRKPSSQPTLYRAQMPVHEDPYRLFAMPHADITLSSNINRSEISGESRRYSSYSLIAGGDLGYMSSQIFLGGSSEDRLTQARLLMERGDPDARLLGAMSATKVQLGDLNAPALPLMRSNASDRGLLIERSPMAQGYDFDQVDLNGNIEPGWEIELYWNDSLIDRQLATEEGRYDFNAVPLYYGDNRFELVFYGPNGEQRREQRSYYVGPGMQKAGRLDYQLVYTEKGRNLFAEGESAAPPSNVGSPRLNGRFSLGLGRGLVFGAGLHSVEFNDVRHDYDHYELRTTLPGVALTLRTMRDSEGGEAHEAVLQSRIGDFSLRGNYLRIDEMVLEGEELLTDRRISEGLITAAMRWGRSPVTFSYRDTRSQQTSTRALSNYFGIPYKKVHISNSLSFLRQQTALSEDDTLAGTLQLNGLGYPLQWRARAAYELQPEEKLNELVAYANLRIDHKMKMNFEFSHYPQTSYNRYKAGMSWRMDEAIISPSLTYDSDGSYSGFINVSFGIGPSARGDGLRISSDRLSGNGSAAALFYADENANGQRDAGEQAISGVSMQALPGHHKGVSDESGYLVINRLMPYQQVDLVVARDSIDDVELVPLTDGVGMLPRPGRLLRLDIPLQRMGEVEGSVFQKTSSGRKSLSGVELWLEGNDGQVLKRVRSSYDGFFLFSEVPVGRYRLMVSEDYELLEPSESQWLEVGVDNYILTGNELLLSKKVVQPTSTDLETLPVLSLDSGLVTAPAVPVVPVAPVAPVEAAVTPMGDSGVQMGAYRNRAAAMAELERLKGRYKDLLSGLKFELQRADLGERGVFHRLIAAGASRERAEQVCRRLKDSGQACVVITLP